MTSIDSGVETSNDSNDSYVVQEAHSTPIKSPCSSSVPIMSNRPSSPSTSFDCDIKEKVDDSKAVVPVFPTSSMEPPAGILFCDSHPLNLSRDSAYAFLHSGSGTLNRAYAMAMYRRKIRRMKCVINLRKDPWQDFRVPLDERKLRYAALTNDVERLTALLDAGVDPNCSDPHKRTPLHLASCKGYSEIVRILLQKGANPNQRDSLGNTPLHLAACTNHVGVVTLLLKAGTDVRCNDHFGRNPLQLAQSKLKLLQRGQTYKDADSARIKAEVQQVIEMMLAYLHKQGHDMEAELLNAFSSRLTLSQTKEEVETDVRDLLESLNKLTLSQSEPDKQ